MWVLKEPTALPLSYRHQVYPIAYPRTGNHVCSRVTVHPDSPPCAVLPDYQCPDGWVDLLEILADGPTRVEYDVSFT